MLAFLKRVRLGCRALALIMAMLLLFSATALAEDTLPDAPTGSAQAVLLMDPETGMSLYEENADARMYPASTTKIMTALLVLERVSDLSTVVTMEEVDFEGVTYDASVAGFLVDEEVTVLDLLYGLMLPSGNEAARALARIVAGDVQSFVVMMNERAVELGCTGTNFVNPNGLHDDNHYTTARDLSIMASQAMESEVFQLVVNTAQKTLSTTNLQPTERKVYTTNMLIFRRSDTVYYDNCIGIKTGYTDAAGYCFVSAAEQNGSTLISVVLGCERGTETYADSFYQTKALFEWGFENFETALLIQQSDPVIELPVELSTETDSLVLVTQTSFSAIVPNGYTIANFELTYNVPETLRAPIKAGDVLGTVSLTRDGIDYGEVNLIALSDVALSEVLFYADQMEQFLHSWLFFYIVLGVILFLLIYFVAIALHNRSLRIRRRKKIIAQKKAEERARKAEMERMEARHGRRR